jgi:hypothetical protein
VITLTRDWANPNFALYENQRRRTCVGVATGNYIRGQARLAAELQRIGVNFVSWDQMPEGCPEHSDVPYAFKAYALKEVVESRKFDTILWLDASIALGPAPLQKLWDRIEEKGYWISRNGFRNSEWTANSALQYLGVTREENEDIEHIVAGAMGFSLRHQIALDFISEYYRLATNGSFRGPWRGGKGVQHRHDQTAASVIAWRLKMELTNPPEWLAYRGRETADTVLVVGA